MERDELGVLMAAPVDVLEELNRLLARPAWQADAACREHPELEFVPRAGPPERAVLELCRSCLVRGDYLAYALERDELLGAWGGTTPHERARARAHGLTAGELLDELEQPAQATPRKWETPLCTACGGLLSRKDLARADGYCWACRAA